VKRTLLTSKKQDYGTPEDVFAWLDRQFNFTIDLAADAGNFKMRPFFSPADNALKQSWRQQRGFLNPEYKRVKEFFEKSRTESMHFGALVVHLVPARVDTKWWRFFVMQRDRKVGRLLRYWYDDAAGVFWFHHQALVSAYTFLDRRLPFEGADGDTAPFPSAVTWHFPPGLPKPVAKPRVDLEVGPVLTNGWPRGSVGAAAQNGRRAPGVASSPAESGARLSPLAFRGFEVNAVKGERNG
jgi:hypothetical protein